MNLYRVTMTGCGLKLRMEDGAAIEVGFVKNEFVVAESEDNACSRATTQVQLRLQRQAREGGLVLMDVDVKVDEVVRSLKFWKLVQQEGFIFFPQEQATMERKFLH